MDLRHSDFHSTIQMMINLNCILIYARPMLRQQLWDYLELPEVLVNTDGVKEQTAMNESVI